MLAQERQNHILSLIEERGTVRTIDLAEEFQVTDETIRRDLQALADNDQLTRIHGGACSRSGRPRLQSYSERSERYVEEKKAIAKAALEWIQLAAPTPLTVAQRPSPWSRLYQTYPTV